MLEFFFNKEKEKNETKKRKDETAEQKRSKER